MKQVHRTEELKDVAAAFDRLTDAITQAYDNVLGTLDKSGRVIPAKVPLGQRAAAISAAAIDPASIPMQDDECPRCGYRYKLTRRTRRLGPAAQDALVNAALDFHALQVHGQTLESLRAEATS